MHHPRVSAGLIALGLGLLVVVGLGCGVAALPASVGPRWACPSPTPRPYGEAGPVKEVIRHTRPISAGGDWEELVYYAIWEQEYPDAGGPPFPSPTPYARVGTSFTMGQRMVLGPLAIQATARAGPVVRGHPGIPDGSQQLYLLDFHVVNLSDGAILLPIERARLRAIKNAAGATVSDDSWGSSRVAQQISGLPAPAGLLPPGESLITVPVLAPPGSPEVIELSLLADPAAVAATPPPTTGAGTPTPPPAPTATPSPATNHGLRDLSPELVPIQWTNTSWVPPGGEPCPDPGALTDWGGGAETGWGVEFQLRGVEAPPGSSRLIQVALGQVGKPYVWGAKGPEAFDCSGLATWSYAQIGVRIPQGTAGQWPGMRPVAPADLQPGDLVFFAMGGGRIDHVGLLADVNRDGAWDLIHAANPELGVRVDYSIFSSAYYQPRIRGFRTAR